MFSEEAPDTVTGACQFFLSALWRGAVLMLVHTCPTTCSSVVERKTRTLRAIFGAVFVFGLFFFLCLCRAVCRAVVKTCARLFTAAFSDMPRFDRLYLLQQETGSSFRHDMVASGWGTGREIGRFCASRCIYCRDGVHGGVGYRRVGA